ncbi:3'(2'), 5'-bisphosphate nucleotidase [Geosmithia morbida]|uniref:3'(2'), 5'-bisphosphate nucleotidase n=1 Tax=Geosmithia morbida TaxID=1094350 RepID=A0A9P4YXK1_9HYPO|nr:3'(2'), 5'-bisphosphate nucleotidase [Geosmithia morbida]KAF4123895.1 3'(2'), 5'-bisphosphate nucleotidase [Geosmithia morbida]
MTSITDDDAYERERSVAEAAVLRAALLTNKVQSSVRTISKEDKSPVTVADFAAQALLIAALRQAFPDDGFLGEEDADQLRRDPGLVSSVYGLVSSPPAVARPDVNRPGGKRDGRREGEGEGSLLLASPTSVEDTLSLIDMGGRGEGGPQGRFWVMDPVDGTKTFLRRQQYAVSLALIEDGREVVGVLCCPNLRVGDDGRVREDAVDEHGLGVMLSAVRGRGVSVRDLSTIEPPKAEGADADAVVVYGLPAPEPLARLVATEDVSRLHVVDSPLSTAIRHDVVHRLAAQVGAPYPGTDVWSSHMRYAALILGGADCQVRVPAERRNADGSPAPPPNVCIWDHAGAQLIFSEAGGVIRDLDGLPINFGAGRYLSSNRDKEKKQFC